MGGEVFSSSLVFLPTRLFMITDVRLNIILHPNQALIHRDPARFKVIKAGKRFGKSKWAVFEIAQWAGMKVGGTFWYIAPTFGQAADIAWQDLLYILPESMVARRLESKLTVELKNKSRIILKGAENEDGLRGPGLDGVIFDEAAYMDQYIWPAIVRGQLAMSRGPAYFISSPNKKGINWYTAFCKEAERKKLAGNPEWAFYKFTIYDNPILHKTEIEEIKQENTDDTWSLEYMAEESEYAGQLYHEFNYERNVGEYSGTDTLPVFRALDWGIAHPTVCLFLKLDLANKTVYVYDEFVKSGSLIVESCEEIKRMTGNTPVEWSVIDPSTAKRNSQTGRTDKDEFARWGITCIPGDNRDRGIDITKMFLKKGMIKIHPKCKNLIAELKNLQRGQKEGDDVTDSLRYGIVRINDYIYGMNVIEAETRMFTPKLNSNQYSFYDTRIFPPKQMSQANWVLDEIEND